MPKSSSIFRACMLSRCADSPTEREARAHPDMLRTAREMHDGRSVSRSIADRLSVRNANVVRSYETFRPYRHETNAGTLRACDRYTSRASGGGLLPVLPMERSVRSGAR